MARILKRQDGVVNRIDEVLVFGRTQKKQHGRLKQVLSCLAKSGITLNQDRCHYGVPEVLFLGVVILPEGIRPEDRKSVV